MTFAYYLLKVIDLFLDLPEMPEHLQGFHIAIGRPSIDPELMPRRLIVIHGLGV